MTASGPPLDTRCAICGLEELDPRKLQACFGCGATFHLNPRQDVAGIDCGDAWLGEQLGLEYYCRNCIQQMEADAANVHGDPARAVQAQLMHMVTPGVPTPPPAGPAVPAPRRTPEASPPPRPPRPLRRRRYRRLDA